LFLAKLKILQTACGGTTDRNKKVYACYLFLSPKAKQIISLSVYIRVNPCPNLNQFSLYLRSFYFLDTDFMD